MYIIMRFDYDISMNIAFSNTLGIFLATIGFFFGKKKHTHMA